MKFRKLAEHPANIFAPTPHPVGGSPQSIVDVLAGSAEGKAFLEDAGSVGQRLLLVVNDPHRATPTGEVMEALACWMASRGSSRDVDVLVATGTHRIPSEERCAFEADLAGRGLELASIAWHDATSPDLSGIGGAIYNSALRSHDFLLPIGSVEPHYFAGLTGAHKTVTIGCLSRADIEHNHAGALSPASDLLVLDGNPVHEGIVELLRGLHASRKRIFTINTIAPAGKVASAAAGDPLVTLKALAGKARELFVHEIDQPSDLLILDVPMPLGRSLYQADKALKNNHRAVRDGGAIVLLADCLEGVGDPGFLRLLAEAGDYASAIERVSTAGYRLGDHKAVKLHYLTDQAQRGVHVAVVSRHLGSVAGLPAGIRTFSDGPAALAWLEEVTDGPKGRAILVRDAGFSVVRARC